MGSSKAAMEEDGAVLEWALYDSNSKTAFQKLYNDTDFSDVTLACEDNGRIEAHRAVLGVSSDFFLNILKETSTPHSLIYLEGVTLEELQLIKSFVYLGKATVRFSQYESFANISKRMLGNTTGKVDDKVSASTEALEARNEKQDTGKYDDKESCPTVQSDEPKSDKEGSSEKARIYIKKQGVKVSTKELIKKDNTLKRATATEQFIMCRICMLSFPRKYKLRKHMETVHFDLLLNLPCTFPGCDKVLKNKGSLNNHMKSLHREHHLMCDHCDYSTGLQAELTIHNRKHTGDLKQCEFCSYSCTKMSVLKQHKESRHLNESYTCEQCGAVKKTKVMMRRHMRIVHDGIVFYCELCSHKSTSAHNLRVHKERVHDKLSIKCQFCSYKDAQKCRVILHEKREHPNLFEI